MRGWAVISVAVALIAAAPVGARAQEAGIAVGARAPAVILEELDGTPVDLGRLIGKRPFVLEFWATWCEVCTVLLPRVREAHRSFGDRVEFFGVNVTVNQTRERVRRYVTANRPPFRTLYDDTGAGIRAYRVPATSFIVIVDRSGTVAYTGTGRDQNLDAALRAVAAQ